MQNSRVSLDANNQRAKFVLKIEQCKRSNLLTDYEREFVEDMDHKYTAMPEVFNPTRKQWNFLMGIQL